MTVLDTVTQIVTTIFSAAQESNDLHPIILELQSVVENVFMRQTVGVGLEFSKLIPVETSWKDVQF
jgi:hypothetical protein